MPLAEAPPRAPDAPRPAKPLSSLASLGIATVTGAAVFAAGVLVIERRWLDIRPRGAAPLATSAATTAAPPDPGVAVATAAPATASPDAAAATASPDAATATAAPAVATATAIAPAPEAPAAPADRVEAPGAETTGSGLPPGQGWLKVTSSAEATVYVNGVDVGAARRPLAVRCGRFFVRLGAPSPEGTRWMGPGKTVVIPCGGAIEEAF